MELKLKCDAMDLAEVFGIALQRAEELTDTLNDLLDGDGPRVDIVKIFNSILPSLPDNEILYVAFQLGRFVGRQEAFLFIKQRDTPGEPAGWRGLNLLYRCQQCGQHFVLDSLRSLEADLSREVV